MIWCSPGRFIYLTDKVDEPGCNESDIYTYIHNYYLEMYLNLYYFFVFALDHVFILMS